MGFLLNQLLLLERQFGNFIFVKFVVLPRRGRQDVQDPPLEDGAIERLVCFDRALGVGELGIPDALRRTGLIVDGDVDLLVVVSEVHTSNCIKRYGDEILVSGGVIYKYFSEDK